MKWVVGFPANGVLGLPTIAAVIVMNDSLTGRPIAILDGGPITAARTAAISGRRDPSLRATTSVGRRAPGRDPRRRGAGPRPPPRHRASPARGDHPDLRPPSGPSRGARAAAAGDAGDRRRRGWPPDAREAVAGADVVISAASFGPVRQVMTNDWLAPDALVVPVDYATTCAAEVARDAALFLVDEHRPVRGEPRGRSVRRLPGSDDDPRGGDPRRRRIGRSRAGSSRRTSASGWPTSSSPTRSCRRAPAGSGRAGDQRPGRRRSRGDGRLDGVLGPAGRL